MNRAAMADSIEATVESSAGRGATWLGLPKLCPDVTKLCPILRSWRHLNNYSV